MANIISISDRFDQRFNNLTYTNPNNFNAHPTNLPNYCPTDDWLKSLQSQSNVFCAHLSEYLSNKKLTEHYLPNRKYIIIEFPQHSRTKFFQQRLARKLYYQDQFMLEELSTLYSMDIFSKITGEKDLTKININLLFTESIIELLLVLNQELGLVVDQTKAEIIHQQWIKNNGFY